MKSFHILLIASFTLTACATPQTSEISDIDPVRGTSEVSEQPTVTVESTLTITTEDDTSPEVTLVRTPTPEANKFVPFPEEAWKTMEESGYANEFSETYAVGEHIGDPYPVEVPHCIYKIGDVKKVNIQVNDLTIIRAYECHYKGREQEERVIYLPLVVRNTKTVEWYNWRSNVSNLDVGDGYLDGLIEAGEAHAKEFHSNGYGLLQFDFDTSHLSPTTVEFFQSALVDNATISDAFRLNGDPSEFPDLKGTNSNGETIIFENFVIPASITWQ